MKQGYNVSHIVNWGPTFFISFDLKFASFGGFETLGNILRFTSLESDGNEGDDGRYVPALFVEPELRQDLLLYRPTENIASAVVLNLSNSISSFQIDCF